MNDILHHLLREWGKKQQRLPDNHVATKEKVLATLHPREEKIAIGRPIRIPWFALGSLGIAVILFFVQKTPSPVPTRTFETAQFGASTSFQDSVSSSSLGFKSATALPSLQEPMIEYFRPTPAPTPVSDTREFLKTNYHATLKTRSVEEVGNRIQTIVRGWGGRIDNASIQTRSAYLSFVVPKKTFEAFKTEIKTLLPTRFMTKSATTQNLLPEKRIIEEKTDMMRALLAEHKKDRDTLEAKHHTAATVLQRQLYGVVAEMKALKAEVTIDPLRQKEIATRLTVLKSDERRINRNLANENTQYNSKRDMLDAQIHDTENQLFDLGARDKNLIENVETVQGSITIEWISIPKIIGLYMPKDWPSILFLGLAVLAFLSYRRRRMAIELS